MQIKMRRGDFGFSLLPCGWYPFELVKMEVKPKKDKAGENYVFTFAGSPEPGYVIPPEAVDNFTDRRVFRYVPSDMLVFLAPILVAAFPNEDFSNIDEIDIDTDKLIGKRMEIYLEQQEYNGKMTNSAAAFAPLGNSLQ